MQSRNPSMLTFNAATIYQTIISVLENGISYITTFHPYSLPPERDEYQYRFLHFIAFNMYTI